MRPFDSPVSHSPLPALPRSGHMSAFSPVTSGLYDLPGSRRFDKIVRFRKCFVPGSLTAGMSGMFSRKHLKSAERD